MMSQAVYSQSVLSDNNHDMSSFYAVTGFHNPILHSGQYMASLTPHYYHSSFDDNSYSASNSLSGQITSQSTSESSGISSGILSYYDLSFASLYGISNDITLNFTFTYFPKQNVTTQQSSFLSSYNSSSSTSANSDLDNYSGDDNSINSSIILSYRPERNLELAFQARYSSSTSVGNMNGSSISNYTSSSMNTYFSSSTTKYPTYDLSFSIVLISN
jgi:hypothetical protein